MLFAKKKKAPTPVITPRFYRELVDADRNGEAIMLLKVQGEGCSTEVWEVFSTGERVSVVTGIEGPVEAMRDFWTKARNMAVWPSDAETINILHAVVDYTYPTH